jgi:hypothetical protein
MSGVCPATARRGQEQLWRPASAAVRLEPGYQEPEITCQTTPRRATDRPAGAFAPSIWGMSVWISLGACPEPGKPMPRARVAVRPLLRDDRCDARRLWRVP